MSMPFLVFSCSQCDFSASDNVCWGRFSYEGPSGLVPLIRNLGWCDKCSDLVPVETLPSTQQIEELKEEIADKVQRVSQCRDRIRDRRSWIKKLLRFPVNLPPEIKELQWRSKYQRTEIEEEQQRLTLMVSRKSSPRCLFCGSTNCFLMPKHFTPQGSNERPGQPVKTGITHPRCGGNLLVRYSGVRLNAVLEHRIYDTEGHLICKEYLD